MDIFCPKCGSSNPEDANFCRNCGQRIPRIDSLHEEKPVERPQNLPPKPENYLVWSILMLIFCCQVCGIIALITSTGVDSAYKEGRYEDALKKSKETKKWLTIGLIGGIIFWLFYLTYLIIILIANKS